MEEPDMKAREQLTEALSLEDAEVSGMERERKRRLYSDVTLLDFILLDFFSDVTLLNSILLDFTQM